MFVGLVALLSLALAPAAFAAAPSNDTYAGRITVSDGYSATLDTTEATTDSDDTEMNSNCGAPATDASVWYELKGTGDTYSVDVSNSDYSAGVIVATGSPGSFSIVTCGPELVAFPTTAGTNYEILAFDDQEDGSGNGGQLSIAVNIVLAPSIDAFSVNSTATFHKDGSATVSGTVTCSNTDFVEIDIFLQQTVGRTRVQGFGGSFDTPCDGTSHSWSVDVSGDNGLFRGGKATASASAFACTFIDCAESDIQKTLNLKK